MHKPNRQRSLHVAVTLSSTLTDRYVDRSRKHEGMAIPVATYECMFFYLFFSCLISCAFDGIRPRLLSSQCGHRRQAVVESFRVSVWISLSSQRGVAGDDSITENAGEKLQTGIYCIFCRITAVLLTETFTSKIDSTVIVKNGQFHHD